MCFTNNVIFYKIARYHKNNIIFVKFLYKMHIIFKKTHEKIITLLLFYHRNFCYKSRNRISTTYSIKFLCKHVEYHGVRGSDHTWSICMLSLVREKKGKKNGHSLLLREILFFKR